MKPILAVSDLKATGSLSARLNLESKVCYALGKQSH